MKNRLLRPISFILASALLFACTKTEIEEVEVERIVEVPTAIDLTQVSLASSTTMSTEADAQTIVVSAAIANALTENTVINLNFAGSAERNTDYITSANAITIPAGETTGALELTIVADNEFESGVENIIISLAGLPNTVTPSGNSSTVQIDVTDGAGIVSFTEASLTVEEDSFYNLPISLSKPLNDDIVVNFQIESTNTGYGISGDSFIIIPSGTTNGIIRLDLNDSRLTPNADRNFTISIESIVNEDVVIGTTSSVAIATEEVDAGLLIDATWATNSDLFELRIYDGMGNRVASSARGGNTESIFLSKNSFSPLADGMYTIELDDFSFNANSTAEVVTFTFLDEFNAVFGGPYTFTVNNPGDRIVALNLEVANDTYIITQTATSN